MARRSERLKKKPQGGTAGERGGAPPDPHSDQPGRVIVVDDEVNIQRVLRSVLEERGHEVFTTDDGNEVLKMLAAESWDVVIQDLRMPRMHGLELLGAIQDIEDPPLVLVITAYESWDDAVEAMRLGAHDYIRKPFDNEHIRNLVTQAIRRRRMLLQQPGDSQFATGNLIGNTPGMQEIMRLIRRTARTESTIRIRGESGTG